MPFTQFSIAKSLKIAEANNIRIIDLAVEDFDQEQIIISEGGMIVWNKEK